MSILTVGTMAFDSIETPFGKAEQVIGGAATYISWAASYFTPDIHVISVIGGDFPEEELEALRQRGVDFSGLQVRKNEKSFFWAGRYHRDMNSRDTLDTQLNVLADFVPNVPESARNAKFLMLGNLTPEVQMSVIDQMASRPRLIVLDTMNYWMDSALGSLLNVLQHVDVLTINDEEARQLSGEYSLVRAWERIREMGPRYLIIKKGEHGALLFHEDKIFFAPALPLAEVFDPTGAGDSFAGGFIGHIANAGEVNFENMKTAVIYGSAMASFCVEKFSLEKLRSLTQEEIDNRVVQFVQLVNFNPQNGK
jgi:sugar/nucleoside kinase (ribokinase family)